MIMGASKSSEDIPEFVDIDVNPFSLRWESWGE